MDFINDLVRQKPSPDRQEPGRECRKPGRKCRTVWDRSSERGVLDLHGAARLGMARERGHRGLGTASPKKARAGPCGDGARRELGREHTPRRGTRAWRKNVGRVHGTPEPAPRLPGRNWRKEGESRGHPSPLLMSRRLS